MSYYEFEEKKTDQSVICLNNKVFSCQMTKFILTIL